MELSTDHIGDTATLRLHGDFTMDAQLSFRDAYRKLLDGNGLKTLTIDLSRTEYLDSSALGMLIVLKNEAEQQGVQVTLRNCQPFVTKLLRGANFDRLFKIA